MLKKVLAFAAFPSILFLSFSLTGCAPDPDESEDVGESDDASHAWGNYHWARTANPFTLKLGDNLTAAWDPYLATTSSDWSESQVLDTTIVAGSATPKTCKATAGMVQVCNAKYGNNGWLGIAGISLSGGHISAGYVKLNDSYFTTAQYNTPAWKNLVTCQEVGHTFGLGHNDEDFNTTNGTCMDYSNDPVPNQHPDQHDYDQLVTIYSHLDNTTTVNAAVPSGPIAASPDADSPAAWGELVRSKGPMHTYFKDLGNGNAMITEVFWAPE